MTPTADLMKLVESFPEINMSNYNEDDIAALNQWGCEVVDGIRAALSAMGEARAGGEVGRIRRRDNAAEREVLDHAIELNDDFEQSLYEFPAGTEFALYAYPAHDVAAQKARDAAASLAALATPAQPKASDERKPDGYAYRYPDASGSGRTVIVFNSGVIRNGNEPVEAVPYYFGTPPTDHAKASDPYERGLQTPRRVKAVETLLAAGWKWEDGEWHRPKASEAVEHAFNVLAYQAGRLRDNFGMAGAALNIEEAAATLRATHPKASEGKAGGEDARWIECWEGSGDSRGWHIKRLRVGGGGYAGSVAYLGPEVTSASVTAIVAAHNATLTAPGADDGQ